MHTLADLRQLHIEVSTQCNAACPMCARNIRGATAPGLVESSMTLVEFQKLVSIELLSQLEVLDICGAYGDPAMASDLVEMCLHARSINPDCQIRIYTNGGIRVERWWAQLGRIGGVQVVFAIDGVGTNDVYRRRVNTEKVLLNAAAFIGAGGRAQWDFIVFEHNEHELNQARLLSETMGFENFAAKRTARFLRPLYEETPELREGDGLEASPIFNGSGQVVGVLRPPRAEEYVNEVLLWARTVEAKAEYFDNFFDTCKIQCSALDSRSIFISAGGEVYPCCWMYVQATLPNLYRGVAGVDRQVSELLALSGGRDTLNAGRHAIGDIVQGRFFAAIEQSWTKGSVGEGKLKVCSRVCGEGFGAYRKQFDLPKFVP